MSAFLGPIHHWLYNKVLWHEVLQQDILKLAFEKGFNTDLLESENISRYGAPELRPLEEVIDGGNIHGWLQSKIESLEYRMANTITHLLKAQVLTLDELKGIYGENGKLAAKKIGDGLNQPDQIFKSIFDFQLDGMPCDRINNPVEGSEDHYKWVKRACLHTAYWEAVGGDVKVYNTLRDQWMNAFIPPAFTLTVTDESTYEIRRAS